MDHGVFTIVPASGVKRNCDFGSLFADSVLYEGRLHVLEKLQIVVQAYIDKNHGYVKYAPIVQRASQHLLWAICAMNAEL